MQQAKDLMTQKQHIETFVIMQTDKARVDYHTLLSGALDCTRWLLRQGLAFRGHDESLKSSNRGNYIEFMQFLADHNEKVRKVVFENAPKNLKYTSSDIQNDLVLACAIETINAITKDMEVVVEVVKWIKSDRNQDNLGEATRLFKDIQTFDFAFHLFLMRLILGITNELSQALQKKDQDIVKAMTLVDVLDMQLKELNDRFNEVNTELLLCSCNRFDGESFFYYEDCENTIA
nr:uncharacterized protein LOC103448070 [Malus domestica]